MRCQIDALDDRSLKPNDTRWWDGALKCDQLSCAWHCWFEFLRKAEFWSRYSTCISRSSRILKLDFRGCPVSLIFSNWTGWMGFKAHWNCFMCRIFKESRNINISFSLSLVLVLAFFRLTYMGGPSSFMSCWSADRMATARTTFRWTMPQAKKNQSLQRILAPLFLCCIPSMTV